MRYYGIKGLSGLLARKEHGLELDLRVVLYTRISYIRHTPLRTAAAALFTRLRYIKHGGMAPSTIV